MVEHARADGPGTSTPTLDYHQGPMVPRGALGMLVLLLLLVPGLAVADPDLGIGAVVVGWGLVAVLAVVVGAATLPQTHRSVRVDGRGLHVEGRLEVPARRIARATVLTGGQAATWSWPVSRPRGGARPRLPSRQNLYGGLYGWGPAVAVEDRGDATVWLIPSRRPDALARALEHARDAAGGATSPSTGGADG